MDIVTKMQLNILIQLAEADKHFAKAERDMIFKLAKDKNFSEEEVVALIKNPEPINSLGALSGEQKLNYLYVQSPRISNSTFRARYEPRITRMKTKTKPP